MFAVIETNGATQIIIHIPHEGSDKSLPALARLLEQNAVFVKTGWQELSTVKPGMSISLGDSYKAAHTEGELLVDASDAVIGDEFVNASPDVFASNAAALKKERDEISRLRSELDYTKSQLTRANEQVKVLIEVEQEA